MELFCCFDCTSGIRIFQKLLNPPINEFQCPSSCLSSKAPVPMFGIIFGEFIYYSDLRQPQLRNAVW